MKKKVLAVLLGGCMVAGLLAGCGGGGDDAKTSDDGSKDSGKSGGYNFEVVVKSSSLHTGRQRNRVSIQQQRA